MVAIHCVSFFFEGGRGGQISLFTIATRRSKGPTVRVRGQCLLQGRKVTHGWGIASFDIRSTIVRPSCGKKRGISIVDLGGMWRGKAKHKERYGCEEQRSPRLLLASSYFTCICLATRMSRFPSF